MHVRSYSKEILFLVVLGGGAFWDYSIQNSATEWMVKLFPHTAFFLLKVYWAAVLATGIGSIVAFFGGLSVGWSLGMIAATGVNAVRLSDTPLATNLGFLAKFIDRFYTCLYVIPFVLVVSLCQALTGDIGGQWRGWFLILVAGMALGGYQIFSNIHKSSEDAAETNRDLISSILYKTRQTGPEWTNVVTRAWKASRRLRDCQIHSYCESLERTWHLSLVAVMIIESIIPGFYEFFAPSAGEIRPWAKGIGRLALDQSSTPEIVAGSIWVVLFIDLIGLRAIRYFCNNRWLKHYEKN